MQNKLPGKSGHFGVFGGRFVPETLIYALDELDKEYAQAKQDKKFAANLIIIWQNTPDGLRRFMQQKT